MTRHWGIVMRQALVTLLVGVAIMAVVGLVLVPLPEPEPLRSKREGRLIRCGPSTSHTPPTDCPPWQMNVTTEPSRRPYDPNP